MNKELSIVIPVYNVEKYLDDCIRSILPFINSTTEIVLVNDGSTDGSLDICKRYADKDSRIKVVSQINKGSPCARNSGIRASCGKYIMFVDSDDIIIDRNLFVLIYKEIQSDKYDLITYGCTKFFDSNTKVDSIKYTNVGMVNCVPDDEKITWMVENDQFSAAAWLHVIKSNFLLANDLFFLEQHRTEEDVEWIFRVILSSPKIYGISCAYYGYRIRKGSLTHVKKQTRFWENRYNAIEKIEKSLSSSQLSEANTKALWAYLAFVYSVLIWQVPDEPDKLARAELYSKIHNKRYILYKYASSKRTKIIRAMAKIFGFRMTGLIMNAYSHRGGR